MNCRVCGVELTDNNHEHNRVLCRTCRGNQKKQYCQNNKVHIAKLNHDRYIEKQREIRIYQKQYSQTPNGKEACRKRNTKHKTKRERGLGWIPLNECLVDGWEGHHIDNEYVIYVPRELHHSVPHNVFTGKNMDEINFIVLQWYGLYYWMI